MYNFGTNSGPPRDNICTQCFAKPLLYLIILHMVVSHLTFSSTQIGSTPLYVACQNGHKQTVDVLLENGANVNLVWTVS